MGNMMQGKVHFGVGLFVGVLLSAFFFLYFAPRYEMSQSDAQLVKQDKWSGETWIFRDGNWEKVSTTARDWQAVDNALTKALQISTAPQSHSQNQVIQKMKTRYPVLAKLSEEEIRERIKYIYSRKILVDLYLNNINVD